VEAQDKLPHEALGWLVPPLFLTAVGIGVGIVIHQPLGLWGWALAICFAVPVGWLLVSILWPGKPDRTCPECGAEALERSDPRTTTGLVCSACGWDDETASGWLMAEEEGPLEEIVLQQRGRRTPRVDSEPEAD
jgi:hypothetical protein